MTAMNIITLAAAVVAAVISAILKLKPAIVSHIGETVRRIIIGFGIIFIAFNFLFTATVNTGPSIAPRPGVFFEIVANGEMAVALCFGKERGGFDEVLFKGPSGVKIRANKSQGKEFGETFTTEYSHVGGNSTLKISTSMIFFEQNLPIPVIYTINGVAIAGLGDNGAKEKELQVAVQKEYSKLPNDFQQGLREFYQYCVKSNLGLVTMAVQLVSIIGNQVEPFHVDQVINTDPFASQSLQTEFNCN